MNLLISRQAEEDLSEIFAYLAANNSDAAERFEIETKKALSKLHGERPFEQLAAVEHDRIHIRSCSHETWRDCTPELRGGKAITASAGRLEFAGAAA